MKLERTTVQLDMPEAKRAVKMAKAKDPDMNLARLIRKLLRAYVAGGIKL